MREMSDPINAFCRVLQIQADAEDALPELLTCGREDSAGTTTITMVWGDLLANGVENDLVGPELLAPLSAAADLFTTPGDSLREVNQLMFIFKDECNNTIEMPVDVVNQLGNGELNVEQAARQSTMDADANC